ncbi:hypothetical protein [Dactylosporangium salmoneum]|uniref:Uncharacterized protein n=1 Tax=Dactylosporangium salmoneum TaxID=53361 RepID=A0ABP5SVG7_9ACTN
MTNLPTTVEGIEDLAREGGIAVVGAIAGGAIDLVKKRIKQMFARAGVQPEGLETQLDNDAELIETAAEDERADVGDELVPPWRRRFLRLLREDESAADALRGMIEEVRAALPEAGQYWVQTNIARDGSAVYAAQGGNVTHYESPEL